MARSIFLSASIPTQDRGRFFETADPYLIQAAVRELLIVALGRRHIVWGGHPSITPMVWAMCQTLDLRYTQAVTLYQSRFFEEYFPEENLKFGNVVYTEAAHNRATSLDLMRRRMFRRHHPEAAVFIGGMEGILDEYALFRELCPASKVLAVPGPGGAAREVAAELRTTARASSQKLNFAKLFYEELEIDPLEDRNLG